jgi:hypothetical protein
MIMTSKVIYAIEDYDTVNILIQELNEAMFNQAVECNLSARVFDEFSVPQ